MVRAVKGSVCGNQIVTHNEVVPVSGVWFWLFRDPLEPLFCLFWFQPLFGSMCWEFDGTLYVCCGVKKRVKGSRGVWG